jgi:hypothetical protein
MELSGQLQASCRFIPGRNSPPTLPYPLDSRLGGPQSQSGHYTAEIKTLVPTGNQTPIPQLSNPYPRRYTYWVTDHKLQAPSLKYFHIFSWALCSSLEATACACALAKVLMRVRIGECYFQKFISLRSHIKAVYYTFKAVLHTDVSFPHYRPVYWNFNSPVNLCIGGTINACIYTLFASRTSTSGFNRRF